MHQGLLDRLLVLSIAILTAILRMGSLHPAYKLTFGVQSDIIDGISEVAMDSEPCN